MINLIADPPENLTDLDQVCADISAQVLLLQRLYRVEDYLRPNVKAPRHLIYERLRPNLLFIHSNEDTTNDQGNRAILARLDFLSKTLLAVALAPNLLQSLSSSLLASLLEGLPQFIERRKLASQIEAKFGPVAHKLILQPTCSEENGRNRTRPLPEQSKFSSPSDGFALEGLPKVSPEVDALRSHGRHKCCCACILQSERGSMAMVNQEMGTIQTPLNPDWFQLPANDYHTSSDPSSLKAPTLESYPTPRETSLSDHRHDEIPFTPHVTMPSCATIRSSQQTPLDLQLEPEQCQSETPNVGGAMRVNDIPSSRTFASEPMFPMSSDVLLLSDYEELHWTSEYLFGPS